MRFIGLDVHRDFCEVAISEGGKARRAGRVAARPAELELFAQSLGSDDRVVLEATDNALAIARIIEPHVGEVVLAHARKVRAIAEAKVKTDAVDACTLAELLAADLVPRVWLGDKRTRLLRRLVSRRRQLVKQSTRTKNEISAVLLRTLQGRPPVSDVFGKAGRAWLAALELGLDERETVDAGLRQLPPGRARSR
jgi:transposase